MRATEGARSAPPGMDMATREWDTSDPGDSGKERSGESVWDIIDRERAMQPPRALPGGFFEPISEEALAGLREQVAKHNAFMDWFAPYLERLRSGGRPGQAGG